MSNPSTSNCVTNNIIKNYDFSEGLSHWSANCCKASTKKENGSNHYAVVKDRTENWQGLEQDITDRVSHGSNYSVSTSIHVSKSSNVEATLRLEYQGFQNYKYIQVIESVSVSSERRWKELTGTFSYNPESRPQKVVFYLEGPSDGVELHIKSVVIKELITRPREERYGGQTSAVVSTIPTSLTPNEHQSITLNPTFDDGAINWSGKGCRIELCDSRRTNVVHHSGRHFVRTRDRNNEWNGIQQDITGRVYQNQAYRVNGVLRIHSNNNNSVSESEVRTTVLLKTTKSRQEYIQVAKLQATSRKWTPFEGKFLINGKPSSVVVYIEGPPAGIDILVDSLVINRVTNVPRSPPLHFIPTLFGENIIENIDLTDGVGRWFGLGDGCNLRIKTGSPRTFPTILARDSLQVGTGNSDPRLSLSGRFLESTNRSEKWMGVAQTITDKLQIFSTYQVSAWVRVGSGARRPQNVAVELEVEDNDHYSGGKRGPKYWVKAGEVEAKNDNEWYEIAGSFRIEKRPSKVVVYVHGPDQGVDLHVAGLRIFAVDRRKRFGQLKEQTDKIRKRDVVLEFSGANSSSFPRITSVKVKQTQNSFPFGSVLYRSNLDNERFTEFFLENFNWAVFANELKWYHMEPEQGKFNYTDADEILKFCESNNIKSRGHCIFWEVEGEDPKWVSSLDKDGLLKAVKDRAKSLERYKGKFRHLDFINEMLHGSFYEKRLGRETRAEMFNLGKIIDPKARLFLNEYHVDDGKDVRSSPEKYIELINHLRSRGAKIGGIGIQGHNECPIGPIIRSTLDKLSGLRLPIWFTEMEVSSANEHVRAEDLEVMIREAFAHPSVEGIMLWGFWELYMSDNAKNTSHLVNAEGEVNEAGERFVELRKEFLTSEAGDMDNDGRFKFRGFHGTYTVEIATASKTFSKEFVVEKGESPLVVPIKL